MTAWNRVFTDTGGTAVDRRTPGERRESFAQINASSAIEGHVMDRADLQMQERVIRGELTHDEAVAQIRREFGTAPKGP
jgi:Antitoxin VbhA